MVTIIAPVLAIVIATAGLAAWSAYHEANEIYDAQLSHLAKTLLAIEIDQPRGTINRESKTRIEQIERDQKYEKNIAFRVWSGGQLLHRSDSASDFGKRFNADGFLNRYIAGDNWRVFVLSNTKEDMVVEVAERLSIRSELTWFIVGAISLPLILMLPLVLFFAWRGIYRGLRPLSDLSAEVRHRSSNELNTIMTAEQPSEVLPLLDAINGLMLKLGSALETERRFTDYAAHELRTPLAAIKTLYQAARKSEDANEREHLADKLEQAINRATHLVTQLLTLARVSHSELATQMTDIVTLTRECVSDLESHIVKNNLTLHWNTEVEFQVRTHPSLLHTLIHNILHNAINYSPPHGRIDISFTQSPDAAQLTVTDTGPGIVPEERERVFESFYRGEDSNINGASLGLSIVRNIAHKLNLEVRLATPVDHQGLAVSIKFPLASTIA